MRTVGLVVAHGHHHWPLTGQRLQSVHKVVAVDRVVVPQVVRDVPSEQHQVDIVDGALVRQTGHADVIFKPKVGEEDRRQARRAMRVRGEGKRLCAPLGAPLCSAVGVGRAAPEVVGIASFLSRVSRSSRK